MAKKKKVVEAPVVEEPKVVVEKNFIIKCNRCQWGETSTGISHDMKHLHEVKRACPTCGGARKFKCPKCGQIALMRRIKGNAPLPPPKE